MKNALLFGHKRVLALLLMCLLAASAFAQAPFDPKNIAPPPPEPPQVEEFPCSISVVGDFESACILPFEKDRYYDEEPGTLIACQGMTVTYTAYADLGNHSPEGWSWQVAGEETYIDHGDGTITVTWGDGDVGQLIVTVYGPNGVSCTKTVSVRLIEKPHIVVESAPMYVDLGGGQKTIYVCKGASVEFTELSSTTNTDIVGYYWESMMGGTASTQNYRIENVWTDDVVVHRVYNNCGCYDEEVYDIKILEGENLELSCYGTVCKGSTATYSVLSPACDQYFWYVDGGNIVEGQNTPKIVVEWNDPHDGYGIIGIDGNLCGNNACPAMLSKKIPIIEDSLSIKGQTTACVGEAVIYSIPLFGSTEYRWSVTPNVGVTMVPVNGANEQTFVFTDTGTYTISVSYNCEFLECGEFQSEPLTVVVKPKLTIKGEERICVTNPCDLSTEPAVAAFWTVRDMTSGSMFAASFPNQTHLAISFPHPGKYLVTAENSDFCREAEFILNVQDAPPAPTLSDMYAGNPHTACPNSGILLKANPTHSEYSIVWKPVCSDDSLSGNEVTINYGSTVCNVEAYNYDRVLGCLSENAFVHTVAERLPLPITITSPITVCPGTTIEWGNNEVPLQDGFLYRWKIQENMQHCASIQGDAFANAVTLAVNNHTSATYPVQFYVTLERKYCDTAVYDTIHIIVQGQESVDVDIEQSADTVCPGTRVTFTGVGGTAVAYRWKTDEENRVYSGATFSHTFNTPGDHVVTLMYSVLDYCTNTQFFTSETTHVYVHQAPVSNGMYLNSAGNYIGVYVPTPNNYSYEWYFGGTLLTGSTSDTIGFRGYGCYRCVITNAAGCTKTVSGCLNEPSQPCTQVGWNVVSYDPCTATLHLESQVSGQVGWRIDGGQYSIQYQNSTHSEVYITFEEAHFYHITAYSLGDNCQFSQYSYNVTFIPDFTFEKQCNAIVIHNNSKYSNGNMPVAMKVNGVPCINFLAHDATYTHSVSPSGSYTFQLTQPFNCLLGTVTFNNTFRDRLYVTASNGSANPVRTCDNSPLVLTASLQSGTPIAQTTWTFSDGTWFEEDGNTFYHTYPMANSLYTVTASVLDQNGCPISKTVSIHSAMNRIEEGSLIVAGSPVCPYEDSRLLTFVSSNSAFNPSTAHFAWNPTAPDHYTRPTYYTANYSVVVTDNNFCKEQAQKEVTFKTRPTAIIVADSYKCCVGDRVKLFGAPGPDSSEYLFDWTVQDPNGGHAYYSSATVTLRPTIPGTYTINMNIMNNQGCSADASTVHITVYPKPLPPTIGWGTRLCMDDPPVELVGSSSVTTDLHWSNGSTGTHAYYFTPGVASLWYYDPTSGCKSEEAYISIDAQPNFDALLTGCYEKCPEYFRNNPWLPVWGLTRGSQQIEWKWHLDGNGIDNGIGNYTYYPLQLPLVGYGDYYLGVDYNNNNCHVESPTLTITPTKDCGCEDIDVTYLTSWYVKECRLGYKIEVTVCNNGEREACFGDLRPLFESENMQMVWTDFSPTTLGYNGCFSFIIEMEVSQLLPSSTALFELYDECNHCTKDFSVDLMPELECEMEMGLLDYVLLPELSSSVAGYVDFKLDVAPCQRLLALWSEPPMVVNYWYDGAQTVYGLAMVDYATLSRLAAQGGEVCFYAITCEGDKLCKRKVCIPAEELFNKLNEMAGWAKRDGGENGSRKHMERAEAADSPEPRLMPNPTTGEVAIVMSNPLSEAIVMSNPLSKVNVVGTEDDVVEVLVLDMNGRQMATFDNTAKFNIGNLASGIYIVRVKRLSADTEKVTYLKLVKK